MVLIIKTIEKGQFEPHRSVYWLPENNESRTGSTNGTQTQVWERMLVVYAPRLNSCSHQWGMGIVYNLLSKNIPTTAYFKASNNGRLYESSDSNETSGMSSTIPRLIDMGIKCHSRPKITVVASQFHVLILLAAQKLRIITVENLLRAIVLKNQRPSNPILNWDS